MFLRRTLSALLLVAGLGTSARASAILFSTLGNPGDTAKLVPSTGVAESFVAASSGIGDLELALSAPAGATGSIVITIMSDANNRPKAVLDTIATLSETQVGAVEGFYDFYNLSVNNLTAGSRYWIDVAKGSSAQTSVYTTNSQPNPGTDSNAVTSGATNYWSGVRTGTSSPLQTMCVSTDNSCDVTYTPTALSINEAIAAPEPTALAMLGTGLIGLGWLRRGGKAAKAGEPSHGSP